MAILRSNAGLSRSDLEEGSAGSSCSSGDLAVRSITTSIAGVAGISSLGVFDALGGGNVAVRGASALNGSSGYAGLSDGNSEGNGSANS